MESGCTLQFVDAVDQALLQAGRRMATRSASRAAAATSLAAAGASVATDEDGGVNGDRPHAVQPHTPLVPAGLGPRVTPHLASNAEPLGWIPTHDGDVFRLGQKNPDHEKWVQAKADDMANYRAMGAIRTVARCDLPSDALEVQLTCANVYKFKQLPDGNVEHIAKSRHCARGDKMEKGTFFWEVSSHSPTPSTIRTLLALLASENLTAAKFDAKAAHLQGTRDADAPPIFFKLPKADVDYGVMGRDGRPVVALAVGNVFGHPAANLWFENLVSQALRDMNGRRSSVDQCLFHLPVAVSSDANGNKCAVSKPAPAPDGGANLAIQDSGGHSEHPQARGPEDAVAPPPPGTVHARHSNRTQIDAAPAHPRTDRANAHRRHEADLPDLEPLRPNDAPRPRANARRPHEADLPDLEPLRPNDAPRPRELTTVHVMVQADDFMAVGDDVAVDHVIDGLREVLQGAREGCYNDNGVMSFTMSGLCITHARSGFGAGTPGQNGGWVHCSAQRHIEDLCKAYNMSESKPSAVPYPSSYKFTRGPDDVKCDSELAVEASALVGGLLFIMILCRADIVAQVSALQAKVSDGFNPQDTALGKRTLRYLGGSKSMGITYVEHTAVHMCNKLICCADSAHNPMSPESVRTGGMTMMNGSIVDYKTVKTDDSADSPGAAETTGIHVTTRRALALRDLTDEFGISQLGPTAIFSDSQTSIAQVERGAKNSRHIMARTSLIKGAVDRAEVVIKKVATEENPADLLTKVVFKGKTHSYLTWRAGYRRLEDLMACARTGAPQGLNGSG